MSPLATLLYGPMLHHLDHLAPLSQKLHIPLFVTDEAIYAAALCFYPALNVQFIAPLDVAYFLLERYEAIVSCLSRPLIEQLFFLAEKTLQKKICSFFCSHGQSDKEDPNTLRDLLRHEDGVFFYGSKMLRAMGRTRMGKKKDRWIGHYRYTDYIEHLSFYQKAIEPFIKKLNLMNKTYLYAPTWEDAKKSSSFISAHAILIDRLPQGINLIIKPHPNLALQHPQLFDRLRTQLSDHPQILFLEECPLIFPILDICSLYIGDASSISYDYLVFDRPMLFLKKEKKTLPHEQIYRCGIPLGLDDYPDIYSKIEKLFLDDQTTFSPIRKATYTFAFGQP